MKEELQRTEWSQEDILTWVSQAPPHMPQQIRRAVDRILTQEQTIHRVVELSLRSKVSMPTDGDNMEEWKQQGFPEDLSDAICQRVHGEPSRRLHRMTFQGHGVKWWKPTR